MIISLLLTGSCGDGHCFNISPNKIELTLAAGKEIQGVITIKNTDGKDLNINLRIEDWLKAVEGIGSNAGEDFGWININPVKFEMKNGQSQNVNYRIAAPKDARGELNAMIFIEGRPTEIAEGAIGINTSIGIPIYAMIKGTEKYGAEVESLEIKKNNPLELAITIKNTGNVHIRPSGNIEIKDKKKTVLIFALNEYNYPVLPDSSRTLEMRSDKRLEAGEYSAEIKMGFSDKKYRRKLKLTVR